MTPVERTELKPGYSISRILKGGWQLAGGHSEIDRDAAIARDGGLRQSRHHHFRLRGHLHRRRAMIGDFRRNAIATGTRELLKLLKRAHEIRAGPGPFWRR